MQAGLSVTWSETPKTGFLVAVLIYAQKTNSGKGIHWKQGNQTRLRFFMISKEISKSVNDIRECKGYSESSSHSSAADLKAFKTKSC